MAFSPASLHVGPGESVSVAGLLGELTFGRSRRGHVPVPVRLLQYIQNQFEAANEQRRAAHNAGVEDDTVLNDTIEDDDVISALRQHYSSRPFGLGPEGPNGGTARLGGSEAGEYLVSRRSSAESMKLVRQVLKLQRLSKQQTNENSEGAGHRVGTPGSSSSNNNNNKLFVGAMGSSSTDRGGSLVAQKKDQKDLDDFLALSWHLCQRKVKPELDLLFTGSTRSELLGMYTKLSTWGVDVREVRSLLGDVQGSELVFVVLCSIYKLNLGRFIVDYEGPDEVWDMYAKLANFAWAIADSYLDNPYHNVSHAADVTQTCLAILSEDEGGLAAAIDKDLQLAFILAACVHDAGHVGVSNIFLSAVEHPLALRYNDFSPLEQLHCCTGMLSLREVGCNFLATLKEKKPKTFAKVKNVMIQLVLGTDMKHHFKYVASLRGVIDDAKAKKQQQHQSSSASTDRPAPMRRPSAGGSPAPPAPPKQKSPSSLSSSGPEVSVKDIVDNEKKLLLLLKECIHAADISNPAKPWPVCKHWTDCVITEFYAQGDRERLLGLPISHGMDRLNPIPLPTFQIGFIKALVKPLFEVLNQVRELDLSAPLQCLEDNLAQWNRILTEPAIRAANKSKKRAPSLAIAVKNADAERRLRDQATQAFAKLHLTHAKHAANRSARLKRAGSSAPAKKPSSLRFKGRPRSLQLRSPATLGLGERRPSGATSMRGAADRRTSPGQRRRSWAGAISMKIRGSASSSSPARPVAHQ